MSEQAQNLNACRHSLGKPALLLFLGMELGRRGVGKGPTSLSVQQRAVGAEEIQQVFFILVVGRLPRGR